MIFVSNAEFLKIQAELRFLGIRIPDLHHRAVIADGHITHLDLSGIELDYFPHFPVSITNLPRLRHLNLSDNYLTEFPEDVLRCCMLKTLNLKGNHISKLPNQLTELHELEEINLKGNQVHHLPSGSLPRSIQRLNLRSNKLREFPDVAELDNLTALNLANNEISTVVTSKLPVKLEYLNLRSNLISALPERGWGKSLRKLNLINNPLRNQETIFPESVCLLQNPQQARLGTRTRFLRPRIIDLRFSKFYPPQFGMGMSAIPFTPVMIYGEEFVGKRRILEEFLHHLFVPDREMGVVQNRYQNWDHYIFRMANRFYQLWYPSNQDLNDPNYRSGIVNGFYYAAVFFLVFDLSVPRTFLTVVHAIRRISAFRTYHTPILVIGNKSDLQDGEGGASDFRARLDRLEESLGRSIGYIECSAESRDGIAEIFSYLFKIYST